MKAGLRDNEHMDYEKIYLSRFKVLKIAFENAKKQGLMEAPEYQKFITDNAYWLDDYAPYMAVKMHSAASALWNGTRISVSEKRSASQVPQKLG
ncbi:MAG: 4-alpha-glucanotransferase [Waltera sp.]